MTVIEQTPENKHTGNGVLTTFDFDFRLDNAADLEVYINEQLQVEAADYNVDPGFDENGGTVTFLIPPPSASIITLLRGTPEDQQTDYQAFDAFPAESHESALDKLTMLYQELKNFARFGLDKLGLAWDALNFRITNLSDPQNPDDAVNQRSMENYVLNNAPEGPKGDQGDQGVQGDVGPAGLFGPPGVGTTWFDVSSAPDTSLGIDGDFALNNVNGDYYQKGVVTSGVWTLIGNLQGPVGGGGGTNNHSALINLTVDDHPQYHTDARGDARYPQTTQPETITGQWNFTSSNIRVNDIGDTNGTFQLGTTAAINKEQVFRLANSNRTVDFVLNPTGAGYGIFDRSAPRWAIELKPATNDARIFGSRIWMASDFDIANYSLTTHTHDTTDVNQVPARSQASSTTLLLSDAGKKVELTTGGSVSIPTNAAVPYSGPVVVIVRQGGSGAVTISPNTGVTLRSFPATLGARTLAGEYAEASLHYRPDIGINTWDLNGRFV